MKLLVINGPNMNMLGVREPEIYGTKSYRELVAEVEKYCRDADISVEIYQSNHEGDIVDKIQSAYGHCDGIVINPAAYTHTSIAIADALRAVGIKTAEVHISDVDGREDFRRVNHIRELCCVSVCGHGTDGYIEAIKLLCEKIK